MPLSHLPPATALQNRRALLHGVSLAALLLASSEARAGSPFRSISQALALAGHVPAYAAPAAGVTAARQAQLGAQNLAIAASRFRSLSDSLTAAAAQGHATVADGLAAGGLDFDKDADGNAVGFSGATTPQQTVTSTYNVTVKQTQALAQLTWKTFNVGAHTHLTFDQSAGGTQASSWVAINSVQDPLANPSQILGSISAPGKVYILNRNGIAFGAGATIDVGALVAATADIAQSQFGTDANGLTTFNLYGAQAGKGFAPTFVNGLAASAVTVASDASIETTPASGTTAGGYVLLLGGNVDNEGGIGTPQGQAVLAAGTEFTLRQGSQGSTSAGNTTSTTLGSEVAALNLPQLSPVIGQPDFPSGTVLNGGAIVADQGDISLVGHAITQAGVLFSTTTVNTRGTIHLLTPTDGSDPRSSITLAANSVTEILPEDDGATALDSQRAADVAASVTLNALRASQGTASALNPQLPDHSILPDQFGESRIELSGGGTVDLQPGAIAVTPGGQVAIAAASRVLLEAGSTIDVSGSTDAVLPSSVNDLLVNIQPYQLRDSAANRDGGLKSTNIYVDARTLVEIASGPYGPTAANPLGNIYTPGGLVEVDGFLGLVAHGIDEWTAIGGQVTLQSQATDALTGAVTGQVITQPGSVINLTGGTVTYQAGPVHQTYLQATNGVIYNANTAPGNLVYTGLYTGDQYNEPRWRISETFINPLLTPPTTMDSAYVVGRDAGSLTVSAPTTVLQGAVPAGVTLGQNQDGARPAVISDPYLLAQSVVPQAGALAIGDYVAGVQLPAPSYASGVLFSVVPPQAGPATIAAPLAPGLLNTAQIDAPMLDQDGFAQLTVTTTGDVRVASPIEVADGGAISLAARTIEANTALVARGGAITLTNLLAGQTIQPPAPPASATGTATTGTTTLGTVTPIAAAIVLDKGATLDARGVWTNAVLDPVHVAGEGLVRGGTITVDGAGAVVLAPGTGLDVSSGGAILPGGKTLSGAGGSITVIADVDPSNPVSTVGTAAVEFAASFTGYGSAGGGTLSLTAPDFRIGTGDQTGLGPAVVALAPGFFQTGFASYAVDGTTALSVLPGAQITVAEPIYVPAFGLTVPTGGDPSRAYSIVLPPLFTPVRGGDTASQRGGASISLFSDLTPTSNIGGGPIFIDAGATVAVDPGQSIIVAGHDRITVFGTLTAHGGTVEVANTRFDTLNADTQPGTAISSYVPGESVWIGDGSVIDVSGQAEIFLDPLGRRFGTAGAGGLIELGGYGGLANPQSTWAQVIVRPGATLDADGASATVDILPGEGVGTLPPVASTTQAGSVTLAGNGGTLVARSLAGVALDGTFTAQASGAGASGGALFVSIDPSNVSIYSNIPAGLYQPEQILVTQDFTPVQAADLAYNQITPDSTFGLGRISQAQIDESGIAQLSLSAGDFIAFQGQNVSLHTPGSITLTADAIGVTAGTAAVVIAAPIVTLGGITAAGARPDALNDDADTASLVVQADLIELDNTILLGGTALIGTPPADASGVPAKPVTAAAYGFAETDFDSTGDIRTGQDQNIQGQLESRGNIVFRAAQLTPISNTQFSVFAGVDTAQDATGGNALGSGSIIVESNGGPAPAPPDSVGGLIALVADSVTQDGVIRAPQGRIQLGFPGGFSILGNSDATVTGTVTLGAGSVTSVSLLGQTVPYGGTVDGVNYTNPFTGNAVGVIDSSVSLYGQGIAVDPGATLDLRGGGTLSGAAFVVGRGGSVDVLRTPLLNLTGEAAVASGLAQTLAEKPAGSSDPVYAILPGAQPDYAPATTAQDAGYSTPSLGERITVGAGVPGLPAGTYTLLPAYYALLPGGFRVELTGGTVAGDAAIARGNFSSVAPVTIGTANTAVESVAPAAAIFTDGTGLRQLSQYDEESYNVFEQTTGSQFGAPRPFLPQDAKTLTIGLNALGSASSNAGTGTSSAGTAAAPIRFALQIDPASLLQAPDPVAGGYGATVQVTGDATIDLLGTGDTPNAGDIAVSAGVLSGLQAPRLLIGGTIAVTFGSDVAVLSGVGPGVTVFPHAVLTAGDVMLAGGSSGVITVEGSNAAGTAPAPGTAMTAATANTGATISATGTVADAFGLAQGFYFDISGTSSGPVLDVSHGQDVFLPNALSLNNAAIIVQDGASLLASRSLNFVAPQGTSVGIGAATLSADFVSLQVGIINLGTASTGAAALLPTGFNLTPTILQTLLAGDAAAATPPASQLVLTATQQVDILDDATLDTAETALVLNTPAIYGVATSASATGTASITTQSSFTWNGIEVPNQIPGATGLSAAPGARPILPNTAMQDGALVISAGTITLGYGPQTQADDQARLDRLLTGFSNVALQGTSEITANNQSTLAVYAAQAEYGKPGTGGDLTLLSPLITTDAAAVLGITAGGSLTLASPGAPAATASVTTLGGEIDLAAGSIDVNTAIALPAGRLTLTAQDAIGFAAAAHVDLSGRSRALFDQTANTSGGTFTAESTAGGITEDAGALIDVSSPAAAAGSASFSALAGTVALDGSLDGSAPAASTAGSLSVIAGTLTNFDTLNATLDAGGFTGARAFEIATGDLAIDTTIAAHNIAIVADAGSIDITGRLDASGASPGSITVAAGQSLALEPGASIDAHATTTALDSYGQPVDAENRAHVTLTAAAGTLALAGGTIDVSYPGEATADTLHPGGNPQGEVVLNAPRLDAGGNAGTAAGLTYGDVALSVTGTPSIAGAASIALYATGTYSPTDPLGTIEQGTALGGLTTPPPGAVTLSQIDADSNAFIAGFATTGAARLGGLASYGAVFHVRPGVIVASTSDSSGTITISGDLDLSGLRYAAGAGYGTAKTGIYGSGEPGSIVFRASDQLVVNGSVSDGFAPPPDSQRRNYLTEDDNWALSYPRFSSGAPLGEDVILPSSISVTTVSRKGVATVTSEVALGRGTVFSSLGNPRPVSLNYDITIAPATIRAGQLIPFAVSPGVPVIIPAGGWVATAPILRGGPLHTVLYAAGAFIPGNTLLGRTLILGAGTVLPEDLQTANDTLVPQGTLLNVFAGTITLSAATALLPVGAFIPSDATPIFLDDQGNRVRQLELRPVEGSSKQPVQGLIYPLATLLPAGSLSWDLSFVSGADQGSADTQAVTPRTVLFGGALQPQANTAYQAPGSLILDDQHDFAFASGFTTPPEPAFSVIRTGTGNLSLVAGGNFDQSSLFGLYTAGGQTSLGSATADAPYQSGRALQGSAPGETLPGTSSDVADLNHIIGTQSAAYYPNDGGDVLVSAQGSVTGDQVNPDASLSTAPPSDAVGDWLWRQGGAQLGQLGAWFINYGTVTVAPDGSDPKSLHLVGFEGIGALGGGNVSVVAGGDAGQMTDRSGALGDLRGEGLVVAVGGSGRVVPADLQTGAPAQLLLTGGGTETIEVGGTLNAVVPVGIPEDALNGDLIDLRSGTSTPGITVAAGAIGQIRQDFTVTTNPFDPRTLDPFAPSYNNTTIATSTGGLDVIPGDATVDITTQRDLVLGGAGDPGREQEQAFTQVSHALLPKFDTTSTGGDTGFSLWTDATAIRLFSDGGNATPTTEAFSQDAASGGGYILNDAPTDYRFIYPSTLLVTAATGSIVYGTAAQGSIASGFALETAPSPDGQIAFLAGTSIFANDLAVDMSGASLAGLTSPFNPAYTLDASYRVHLGGRQNTTITNIRQGAGTNPVPEALFALEADTPTGNIHASDPAPALFYAAGGDIVNLVSGQTVTYDAAANEAFQTWYLAAKPVRIMASNDIVSSGTRPADALQGTQQNQQSLLQIPTNPDASGDLLLNDTANSISVVSAGRDILSGYFYVGGPGLLEVDAGRNLFQGAYASATGTPLLEFGAIRSLGPLLAGAPVSLTGGADIAVQAGIAAGVDYSAFAALYLDPANQANLSLPITDPANAGKVQEVYSAQLMSWLLANYPQLGPIGDGTAALAAFETLPQVTQDVFVREVYFDELLASGRQYNDPTSRFFGSYVRGKQAIDTLFAAPAGDTAHVSGVPSGYTGDITMLSGPVGGLSANGSALTFDAGVSTLRGGTIQVLDPGGQILLGTAGGPAPGGGSGIITNGSGDIAIYALDSVLLGKSRIFTTAGGNIQVWSSLGDINAGIGASTSVVFTPPVITYDDVGGLTESAAVPTSGAGIATLAPLPGIPAGDVDLTAPVGTIDAGEAGIRVSGNLNLAAAVLANTANITVAGKTTGNSTPASVSLGAVEAAGAAAGAATNAAQNTTSARPVELQPSIIEVDVIGVSSGPDADDKRRKRGL